MAPQKGTMHLDTACGLIAMSHLYRAGAGSSSTARSRKSDVSPGSSSRAGSPFVRVQRDGTRPIRVLFDQRQGGEALGVAVGLL